MNAFYPRVALTWITPTRQLAEVTPRGSHEGPTRRSVACLQSGTLNGSTIVVLTGAFLITMAFV